jgi:hypothetical protein
MSSRSMHAAVELGVKIGTAQLDDSLVAWCIIATSAPDQPVVAVQTIRARFMRDRAMHSCSISQLEFHDYLIR